MRKILTLLFVLWTTTTYAAILPGNINYAGGTPCFDESTWRYLPGCEKQRPSLKDDLENLSKKKLKQIMRYCDFEIERSDWPRAFFCKKG